MNVILKYVVLMVSISMCYSRPQMEDKAEMPMPVSISQLLPKYITLKSKFISWEELIKSRLCIKYFYEYY